MPSDLQARGPPAAGASGKRKFVKSSASTLVVGAVSASARFIAVSSSTLSGTT
jgi:hypothetical protein